MVENQKKRTVLTLAGIDKRWVQAENGRWVDEATMFVEKSIDDSEHDEVMENEVTKKRWWQIFK
ncbi:MAG: hypothetical protein COA33_013505 [Fluviicola sp.]|nr:hypothetical protein [Fluviicola sp.]